MSDVQNAQPTTPEIAQQAEPKKRGMKSAAELKEIYQAAGPDGLTTDELTRYRAIVDLEVLDANRVNALEAAEKSTRSRVDRIEKYKGQGRELAATARSRQTQQDRCSHLKGGRGLEALQDGGTDASDYAVLKHILPSAELWVRCLRCGKTWKKPHPQDFAASRYDKTKQAMVYAPLTPEQSTQYSEALAEYSRACKFPTQNSTSSGITFGHSSGDGNKTANDFVHEVYANTNLR